MWQKASDSRLCLILARFAAQFSSDFHAVSPAVLATRSDGVTTDINDLPCAVFLALTAAAPLPPKGGQVSVPESGPAPARGEADATALDEAWLPDPELVDPAYTETMAESGIQTTLPPPEIEPPPPEWLLNLMSALGDFFVWSAPLLRVLMWGLGALLLLYLLYRLFPPFTNWIDGLRNKVEEDDEPEIGVVEAGRARARLADADALAREGRYAEAVHLLLYRSVDDIAARRPDLVKPALTSRDLATSRDLPAVARGAFSCIARAVEVSLFGGRSVDSAVWDECRAAYSELTVPKAWALA